MKTLILYSTTDGHTKKICQYISDELTRLDHEVALVALNECAGFDLHTFDKIVVGASIRYGRHHPDLLTFLRHNQAVLTSRPTALFSVNLVARKVDKDRPDTNPYMIKLIRQLLWRPQLLAVFAGKIDYARYGFFDRHVIRLTMWLTHGPTRFSDAIDFTDWRQVEGFAREIGCL